MARESILIVGGGLAGLSAAMRAAELGADVTLFSTVPVKRSHSVCAQGGINGAVNTKGEGDSPWEHFDDTVYGGDFLANQPPVKEMCEAAPGVIYLLDRMGVPFNRTPEGLLDFRRFGGTKHHRTAFAGATTGQQLVYALDEQVRRWEAEGRVRKLERHEFLGIARDEQGRCRGLLAMDLHDMSVRAYPGQAVLLCTGGPGAIFGKSTNSMNCTGSAVAAVYRQGALYANGEFIQVHPTSIPGEDKLRLMSESARGEGGRVWVPKDPNDRRTPASIPETERFYFLEEWYPAYGNLVPRDIATRAIFKVCTEMRLGVHGRNQVYLDLTHIPARELDRKLGGILEIYEKFVGEDPRHAPMRVFPGVHYSMGGLWVDYDQMTSVPGLFAAGECEYQYHGANRLGANSLLSCIHGGLKAADRILRYIRNTPLPEAPASVLESTRRENERRNEELLASSGPEHAFQIHHELGEWMTEHATVVRRNDGLTRTLGKIDELKGRFRRIGIHDRGSWANQVLVFARNLENMLELAHVITAGALARNESRGAHYKPEFPERDDAYWLKTTLAAYTSAGPKLSYEDVDVSLIPPRARKYDVDKKA
jgi:succinate dehydrogenase / fumarate reductase, flavoprotein subunit